MVGTRGSQRDSLEGSLASLSLRDLIRLTLNLGPLGATCIAVSRRIAPLVGTGG